MADLEEDPDMAELKEILALDPEMAELNDLVDSLFIPKLETCNKKLEPLTKTIEQLEKGIEPLKRRIEEVNAVFKDTRVTADNIHTNTQIQKDEIDELLVEVSEAQMRTKQSEAQLFQSRISSINPFTLPFLYQNLDKKSSPATPTNTTTTTSSVVAHKGKTIRDIIASDGTANQRVQSGSQAVNNNNAVNRATDPNIPSTSSDITDPEPEIIDLCGGSEDAVPYDSEFFEVPNPQPTELARGMKLLAKTKGKESGDIWLEATLLNIITDQGNKKYKVKFDSMGKRLLSGKHIAIKTHPTFEQLKIGSRIVASYRKIGVEGKGGVVLYSGVIAELPMLTNRGRFLIFYDIGYAQYVELDDMYLVYQPTANVWEDDMGDSKDFIMRYLKRYPERPMVRLAVGQWAKTEWKGVWWRAKVKEVDGSLALMHFESDNREEWIYRGSSRLEPLYSELQKAEEAKRVGNTRVASATSNKRRRPTRVEYTIVMKQQLVQPRTRNTAKKSTSLSSMPAKSPEGRKNQTAVKSTSRDRDKKTRHERHRKTLSPSPDIFELDDSEENSQSGNEAGNDAINRPSTSSEVMPSSPPQMIMSIQPPSNVQLQPPSNVQLQPPSNVQQPTLQQSPFSASEMLIAASKSLVQQQQLMQQQQLEEQRQRRLQMEHQRQQQLLFDQQRQAARMKKKRKNQKKFVTHRCNYNCIANCYPKEDSKVYNKNPLRLPEICNWSRELPKVKGSGKRYVIYRTPCSRLLRNMDDVNRYLNETGIMYLSIDHFTFDPFVYTLTRKSKTKPTWKIDDISKGQEPMPISCVNELDASPLEDCEYQAQRLPSGGTVINTDPDFLICCDCTDNCMNKSKCACWKLTIEATTVNPTGLKDPKAGYVNRRLLDHLPTGIFECNSSCKCSQQLCHNRVVQNGIKLRLQCFKTVNRGWGLRCLDDIPRGAFVCTYAGQIWKEDTANERGRLYGDEYFAELDYIEVVENNKEGYESDVSSIDMIDRGSNSSNSSNDEGSDADYHAGSDSDAEYVPFKNNKDLAQVSTRLTFRRQISGPDVGKVPDTQWSVEPVPTPSPESQGGKDDSSKDDSNGPKDLTTQQTQQETTPTKVSAPSTPGSEQGTPKILYGYNINPGNVLDSKALDAFRKRKEKEKALRTKRKLDSDFQKSSGAETTEITLSSSSGDEDSRGSNNTRKNSSPATKPATPASETATPTSKPTPPPPQSPATGGESSQSSFGGFQIEGVTSLAVESDDTDEESDSDETKGNKEVIIKKVVPPPPQPSQPKPKQGEGNNSKPAPTRTRPFYGEEHHYIMDAMFIGNLGRYLNHSCSPNLFVQNVFVDTHDLRFPWVAFFTHERIRANTELTWDYNYDVGSVEGKVLTCYCGSSQCKGRLL